MNKSQFQGAVAIDLHACIEGSKTILPGKKRAIPIGLVGPDCQELINIWLRNTSGVPITIEPGMQLAQLVLDPAVLEAEFGVVEETSDWPNGE